MIKLTIVTINFNNADGLQKTMESVFHQTSKDFEYIIIDGGSLDNSLRIIQEFDTTRHLVSNRFVWISEVDNGIYHAMNKGIALAKGEYIHFLNSGDILFTKDVISNMLDDMPDCEIIYGNMIKKMTNGKLIYNRDMPSISFLSFYSGSINQPVVYTKRTLFERFGTFDETLKIVSDWKWFLEVIVFNGIVPVYKNVDVTIFDMTGISSTNKVLELVERRIVLENLLPLSVLIDYDLYATSIDQYKRLNRYWLTRKAFWFVERLVFKWEKLITHFHLDQLK
jgi:glycosyltransferase involved in cell wall biosynthesis